MQFIVQLPKLFLQLSIEGTNYLLNTDLKVPIDALGYYIGYFIGMLVDIIISAIFTGGAKTVADVLKIISKQFTEIYKFAKSTLKYTAKVATNAIEYIIDLLAKLKNGAKNIKPFLDEILEWLRKWFGDVRKLDWMSSGIFKFGNDGKTFRNFIKLQQRADDGWYNILCHGEPKRVIIDGRKLKPEEFAKMLLEQGYVKGNKIRLIACETGSKHNGFAAQLAKILETKIIAPTERISVDDIGNFVHDKKGKFVEFN